MNRPSGHSRWRLAIVMLLLCLLVSTASAGAGTARAGGVRVRLVADLVPGRGSSGATPRAAFGTRLLFSASDGAGHFGMWLTDGTREGTSLLAPVNSGKAFRAARQAFFFVEDRLWRTDGSREGTREVAGWEWVPRPLGTIGDRILFAGLDAGAPALWSSDGTSAGTKAIAPLYVLGGTEGVVEGPTTAQLGGRLLFKAASQSGGVELWASDGTPAGTRLVKRIGTPAPSRRPPRGPGRDMVRLGRHVLFAARGPSGDELWSTNGTAAGTRLVADIEPGPEGSVPRELTVAGPRVFLQAYDHVHGTELWMSDGTRRGTRLVRDIQSAATSRDGEAGSWPTALTAVGRSVVFLVRQTASYVRLWRSDGTRAGTYELLYRNSCLGWGSELAATARSHVLFAYRTQRHGCELWSTDGTRQGTHIVANINPGPHDSHPQAFLRIADRVYFSAAGAGHGYELWVAEHV